MINKYSLYLITLMLCLDFYSIAQREKKPLETSTGYSEKSIVNKKEVISTIDGYPDKSYFKKYYQPKNMSGSFKFGRAFPTGIIKEAPRADYPFDAPYFGLGGFGMGAGYSLGLEGYPALNKNGKHFWVKIPFGLNLTFGHKPDWSAVNRNIEFKPLSFFGGGCGIMLNASIKDVCAISVYFQAYTFELISRPGFTLTENATSYVIEKYGTSDPFNYYTVRGVQLQFAHGWSIFTEITKSTISASFRSVITDPFGNYSSNVFESQIPYRTFTFGIARVFNKKRNKDWYL